MVLTSFGRAKRHRAGGQAAADPARRARARRHRPRPPRPARPRARAALGPARRRACTPSASPPRRCLGQDDGLFAAGWDDVATALQVSAYSLRRPGRAPCGRCWPRGASIVGLDFDASVAWPAYDWMGVAKAALESATRYLARDLGPAGRPGEPGGRRPAAHGRGPQHPRLRRLRGRVGRAGPRSAGTSPTPSRSPARSSPCCRTGSRPRPARSSTSTAASTPSAPEGFQGLGACPGVPEVPETS